LSSTARTGSSCSLAATWNRPTSRWPAAERELAEETGIDPGAVSCASQFPAYIEYGKVPARPEKDEPVHSHLDFGYAFTTADGDVGRIQESEVTGASWYPLAVAERLVGQRIGRADSPETGSAGRAAPSASGLRLDYGMPPIARRTSMATATLGAGGFWFPLNRMPTCDPGFA
jgi:hypothetical protein